MIAIETVHLHREFKEVPRYSELLFHPFFRKKVVALDDITLRVEEGILFGLCGPNGAGKTTLLKILSTLMLPTSGKAYIAGYDVTIDTEKIKALIGYVNSEERSFYWRLTGRDNLLFFATLYNLARRERKKRIQEIIDLLDLSLLIDRPFSTYSTGMKQKLAIARGLLPDPKILLMDEPTRSLDPVSATLVRTFIKEVLVKQHNRTVFFATHQLEEAEQLCDQIAILNQGRVAAMGSLQEVRSRLRKQYKYIFETDKELPQLQSILGSVTAVVNVIALPTNGTINRRPFAAFVSDEDSIPEILKRLTEADVRVYHCAKEEMSLNEIFQQLVS